VRKAIFSLLTSLFVSVMTLTASYAQGITSPSAGDCTTVEMILANIGEQLKSQGGSYEVTNTADTETFINSVMETFGSSPPYPISKILIVTPTPDAETVSLGFFDGNCLNGGRPSYMPAEVVRRLLKRNDT
jgi:hypothetical protein